MKKKDLEHYEKLLLARRSELVEEMGFLKKAALETTVKD